MEDLNKLKDAANESVMTVLLQEIKTLTQLVDMSQRLIYEQSKFISILLNEQTKNEEK